MVRVEVTYTSADNEPFTIAEIGMEPAVVGSGETFTVAEESADLFEQDERFAIS